MKGELIYWRGLYSESFKPRQTVPVYIHFTSLVSQWHMLTGLYGPSALLRPAAKELALLFMDCLFSWRGYMPNGQG